MSERSSRNSEIHEEGELTPSPDEPSPFLPGFQTLHDYSKALVSQIMLATKASNGLPAEGDDFEYYSSFPGYKTFCDKMSGRANRLISKLLRQQQLAYHWPAGQHSGESGSVEERFEALEEANDALIERVGILLDEAAGLTTSQQLVLPDSEVQRGKAEVASWNAKQESVQGAVKSYSFIHAKTVERPQLRFKHQVDNSHSPFIPLIRMKPNAKVPLPEVFQRLQYPTTLTALITNTKEWLRSDQSMFHPYKHELDTLEYSDTQLQIREPQSPRSLEETPLTIVTTLEQLEALKKELMKVTEFAVDLEHHSYRSYVGFVCLMQISTRYHDYLVDTLELRHHMSILLEPFTDPTIVKVLHGANSDVQWLQRDFGLYLVNMFDTGQASRALGLPRHSLAYLLQYCCSVDADKQFQLADWRIRPLPPEMIKYAREDTHYLLYIYDRMSNELIRRSTKRGGLIMSVLNNSRDICAEPYVKPAITEDSYLKLYYKHKRKFNSQQLHCLQLLYKWRDDLARAEDESTGFVLPNHMLFQIAEILPREPQGVLACCNPIPTLLRQQVQEINILVQKARSTPLTDVLPTVTNIPKKDTAKPMPSELTDYDVPKIKRVTITIDGPPVKAAEPVLTAFTCHHSSNVPKSCEKREQVKSSFPDILSQFLEPPAMTRAEVLQMHCVGSEAPPIGVETTNKKSLVATSTQSSRASWIEQESVKVVNKKKLSVRDMGRESVGDSESPPVKKRRKTNAGQSKATESELTQFEYDGADYTQFAKQGREVKVFNPHSTDSVKEPRRLSRSKTHQKFSERSQSYVQEKKGGKKAK